MSLILIKASILGGAIYAGVEIGKKIETPEKTALRNEISELKQRYFHAEKEMERIEIEIEGSIKTIISQIGKIKGELISISAKQDAEGIHHGFDSDDFTEKNESLIKNINTFEDNNNIIQFWEYEKNKIYDLLDHSQTREKILQGQRTKNLTEEAYHFIKKPVGGKGSWLSSRYGYRKDPFTGSRAWHDGIDFAGHEGTEILAASSGIVIFADNRYGYGKLVEIGHDDGVITRYGHNKEILVSPGDQVATGDVIATMGSSGRSTGPHLHFEVIKDGKSKNPLNYLGNMIKKPD